MKRLQIAIPLLFLMVLLVLPIFKFEAVQANPAYEDFTTYTEVDVPADRIQKTANHIDHLTRRDESTYVYASKGAAHFGDFAHLVTAKLVACDTLGKAVVWAVADALGDMKTIDDASGTYLAVFMDLSSSTYRICIEECDAGTIHYASPATVTISANTAYYLTIIKTGTTWTLNVYTNAVRTSLLGTLSMTLQHDYTLQYIWLQFIKHG